MPKLSHETRAILVLEAYLGRNIESRALQQLSGGRRNIVYTHVEEKVVIKVFLSRDFQNEVDALKYCGSLGCRTPKLVYVSVEYQVLVMQLIEGTTLEYCDVLPSQMIGQLLAETHIRLAVYADSQKFTTIRNPAEDYCDGLTMIASYYHRKVPPLGPIRRQILSVFQDIPLQLSHGSCTPANIIIANNTTYYVDLERMTWAHTTFDLGYFFAFSTPAPEVRNAILEAYQSLYHIRLDLEKPVRVHTCIITTLMLGVYLQDSAHINMNREKQSFLENKILSLTNEIKFIACRCDVDGELANFVLEIL